MSAAAARTDLAFSTHIADQLEIARYDFPYWPQGGLPISIELILRRLNKSFGNDITGLEWLSLLQTVNSVTDRSEDYYERGEGSADSPYRAPARSGGDHPSFFHNVSVWGFTIADAWQVTPELCRRQIRDADDVWIDDGFLEGPSAAFYRTALQVLNPSREGEFDGFTQLDWLEHHVEREGVETLILWLGNNNVLGTALDLEIRATANNPNERPGDMSHERRERRRWNFWLPEDFAYEYQLLLDRVIEIMGSNSRPWRVFVGNIPHVTIAPLIRGLGELRPDEMQRYYFDRYTYFPFGNDFARRTRRFLTRQQAQFIDRTIDVYNGAIEDMIATANRQLEERSLNGSFHMVDMNKALGEVAFKRNNGQPTYKWPPFFDDLPYRLTTHYYDVDRNGQRRQDGGGLFSLDGVHPSIIGQGLVAYEFLKAMQATDMELDPEALDWAHILERDELLHRPISLMDEIYEHERLATIIVRILSSLGKL